MAEALNVSGAPARTCAGAPAMVKLESRTVNT